MKTKQELKQEFRSLKFRAGIFRIRNKTDDRTFLQASADLDRGFNSDLFQLRAGMHSNALLQSDWNVLGPEQFETDILDELKLKETATPAETEQELKLLLKMHIAEMKQQGHLLY